MTAQRVHVGNVMEDDPALNSRYLLLFFGSVPNRDNHAQSLAGERSGVIDDRTPEGTRFPPALIGGAITKAENYTNGAAKQL